MRETGVATASALETYAGSSFRIVGAFTNRRKKRKSSNMYVNGPFCMYGQTRRLIFFSQPPGEMSIPLDF